MVQFADSTDHYDLDADIALKWTQNVLGAAKSQPAPAGRGTRSIFLKNGITKTCSYQQSWYVGFAIYINVSVSGCLLYNVSAGGNTPTTLAAVHIEDDSTISLYAGNSLHLIANTGTIPYTLDAEVWNYIEIGVTTSGNSPILATVTLRVNGLQLLSGTASTGVNSSQTIIGTNQGNAHLIACNTTNSANARDFYIADGTGGFNNNFIGDVRISAIFPRADVLAQWTAVGGVTSTLWDHCNPQFPETNDDTIYIEDQTAGNVGNMLWQPIAPFTGTIPFIHYGVFNRKDAEGSRVFQQTTHGVANGPQIAPGDSFIYSFFAMDTDPATGLPWTQANFNTSSFGVVTVS